MNSTLAYESYSMCNMNDKSIAMYSLKEISTVHSKIVLGMVVTLDTSLTYSL